MVRILLYKLASMVGVLLAVTLGTFLLMQMSSVDPVSARFYLQGMTPDPTIVEQIRQELGLNDPWYIQYGRWLWQMLHGDFGQSIFLNVPVVDLLQSALPRTLSLVAVSIGLGSILSIGLGGLAAHYKDTWVDYVVRIVSFLALAVPAFWVGLLLLYALAVKIPVFSVTNTKGLSAYVLPSITLAIWFCGLYIRRVRNAVVQAYASLPVIGAKTMGIRTAYIYRDYIIPQVRLVLLSMLGITTGAMLGGSAVIETVFSVKGMGQLMVHGIISRDYIVIQSYIVWISLVYVVVNTSVDIWMYLLHPERRYGGRP